MILCHAVSVATGWALLETSFPQRIRRLVAAAIDLLFENSIPDPSSSLCHPLVVVFLKHLPHGHRGLLML